MHGENNEVAADRRIEEKQEEKLVVAEADAIVDPRAMVIHPQNASTANTAMVTTVWLILGTPLAVASISRTLGFVGSILQSTR